MSARLAAAAAVALAAALALTGCSAAVPGTGGGDAPTASDPATQPSDGGDGTDSGAGGDGTDSGDGQATLPATFPSDVPLIEGDVVYAQDLGTGWVVYIARDDFLGGYDEAKQKLLDAGFTGDTVGRDDTGAFGQFTNDAYTVNVQGANAQNTGFGNAVGYTVVKTG